MTSLYQELSQQQPQSTTSSSQLNLSDLLQSYRSGALNEQQILNYACNKNPQLASIMNTLSQSGKTPKQLFFEMAQQKGVDPMSIISRL